MTSAVLKSEITRPFSCKFPLRPSSKLPALEGWRLTTPNETDFTHYGIALQAGEIVLDIDPRNYPKCPLTGEEINTWKELQDKWKLPQTKAVRTPSGGFHFYYTKPADFVVAWHQDDYQGIDFASEGHYVVGEHSVTRDGIYKPLNTIGPVPIPLKFLESLKKPTAKADRVSDNDFEEDAPAVVNKYKIYLDNCTPAVEGEHGNHTTYGYACYGRDLGLSRYVTYEAMWEVFNPRCKPPWTEAELDNLVKNAYRYARSAQGAKSPLQLIKNDALLNSTAPIEHTDTTNKVLDMRQHHLVDSWVTDEKHRMIPNNVSNGRLYLEKHKDFKELFWWDIFASRVKMVRLPWWRKHGTIDFNDEDLLHIEDWITGKMRYRMQGDTLLKSIKLHSQNYSKNPLQEYLDGLKWDGKPRLDHYLVDTAGAEDTPYTKAVGRKFLIGTVARGYQAGCQMDNVLILQGNQGFRKSTWIKILGGEWQATGRLDPTNKDTYCNMLGKWIMELPEINQTIGKRDINAIKAFITERVDIFRKPFDRIAQTVPRTTVFIGTINPTESGYLKDITGERRYWPVSCLGKCDTEKLEEIRDQLFAEAVVAYKKGEIWHLTDVQEKWAEIEQEKVKEIDPWVSVLAPKLEDVKELHLNDVYALLGLTNKEIHSGTRVRIYNSLGYLGYKYWRRENIWKKIDTLELPVL